MGIDPSQLSPDMLEKQFSMFEVMQIVKNLGADPMCGGCMCVALTGSGHQVTHTCNAGRIPEPEVVIGIATHDVEKGELVTLESFVPGDSARVDEGESER